MRIQLDSGAFMPERAHPTDAGIDFKSMYNIAVPRRSIRICPTGVHVEIPHGMYGDLRSKSGLLSNQGIFVTGTVDEGYTGQVKIIVCNMTGEEIYITAGQKIAQMVLVPCSYEPLEVVDKISGGERGANGFGSTGR